MKKTFKKLSLMLVMSLIVLCFCGCSLYSLLFPTYEVDEYAYAIIRNAIGYLQYDFVDELSNEQLIQAAVNGANTILQTYDNYGYFLTPQQMYDLENPQPSATDGFYFGFTYYQIKYVGLYVNSLVVDSEAYRQELKAGDVIINITHSDGSPLTYAEGEDTKELDVRTASSAALQACMGKSAGTSEYKFTVKRGATEEGCFEDGEIITLNIKRGTTYNDNMTDENKMYFVEYYGGTEAANVSSKTISLRSLALLDGSDIGYIHILEFSEYRIGSKKVGTADEVKIAIDALKAAGKKKIIIDLQDNPGGLVSQVKEVASFFIAKSGFSLSIKVATLEDRNNNVETYSVQSKYDNYFEGLSGNIVVLTNGNSASGSEMLLGAILDYGTGVHVGTTTFGKGIAQSYEPVKGLIGKAIDINGNEIEYNYGIYLTIAKYYSPNHINIHGVGYTPEQANIITDYESQMQRALVLLGG